MVWGDISVSVAVGAHNAYSVVCAGYDRLSSNVMIVINVQVMVLRNMCLPSRHEASMMLILKQGLKLKIPPCHITPFLLLQSDLFMFYVMQCIPIEGNNIIFGFGVFGISFGVISNASTVVFRLYRLVSSLPNWFVVCCNLVPC